MIEKLAKLIDVKSIVTLLLTGVVAYLSITGHVVSFRTYLSNAATNGQASGGAWFNSTVDLMNEMMVYGGLVRAAATNQLFNVGTDTSQLPLFALNPQSMTVRQSYWLRDVVSTPEFAYVGHAGTVNSGNANGSGIGVRPRFLIS